MTHDELKALAEAAGAVRYIPAETTDPGGWWVDGDYFLSSNHSALMPYIAVRLVTRMRDELGLFYGVDVGGRDRCVVEFYEADVRMKMRGAADDWVKLTCIAAGRALGVIK